jgi:hypothetical protein
MTYNEVDEESSRLYLEVIISYNDGWAKSLVSLTLKSIANHLVSDLGEPSEGSGPAS